MLPRFEHRPEQNALGLAVLRSLREDGILACEAGTGTGKSFAYLVPSLMWIRAFDERLVISTNTLNLQDQLFVKDLPLVIDALGLDISAVLLKGRSNYLCKYKWHQILSDPEHFLSPQERKDILPAVIWSHITQTGDLSAANVLSRSSSRNVSAIACEHHFCLNQRCPHNVDCYLMRVRRAASQADVVIVNHSLLLSDLVANNALMAPYDRLIVDEAHNLEKIATEQLGVRLSWGRISWILDRLGTAEDSGRGILGIFYRWDLQWQPPHARELTSHLPEVETAVRRTREDGRLFFEQIADTLQDRGDIRRLRYRADDPLLESIRPEGMALVETLHDLIVQMERLAKERFREHTHYEDLLEGIEARYVGLMVELTEAVRDLEQLLTCTGANNCYWFEKRKIGEKTYWEMRAAPIQVGSILHDSLFATPKTTVLTSATLTVNESFDYLAERIGLTHIDTARIRTLMLGSSFDWPTQMRAVVPGHTPRPRDPHYGAAVASLIKRAVLASRRGSLVLFTSYALLEEVYKYVAEDLANNGIVVLAQGLHGSRSTLLERFRTDRDSVLLGTNSFWEGVDVPGEALEMLVISKLPFQVPTEPIVEARSEWLAEAGIDPFTDYMLPEAVIRFRQGLGRLVRNRTDRGVVLVLDNRVLYASYGHVFASALPVEISILEANDELDQILQQWWGDERMITGPHEGSARTAMASRRSV